MIRRLIVVLAAFSLAAVVGCGGSSSEDDPVASYRAAIPLETLVTSAELQGVPSAPARTLAAVGDWAEYPRYGVPVALAINGAVVGHFAIMRFVTSLPPSYFEPATKLMAWGPYHNGNDAGDIMVVVQKDPVEAEGWEYLYQFWRVPEGWNDDGSEVPVLVGVSNPNAPGGPNGVFYIDFDANAEFPGNLLPEYALGGFAASYNQVPVLPATETDPGGVLTMVAAVFRDFVPEETPGEVPVNLDYLYGHFDVSDEASTTVDFLEFLTSADIHDPASLAESLDVRMAFLNGKQGRAEVEITGGDVVGTLNGIECWGDDFRRQYLMMTDGSNTYTEGFPENADPIFSQSLDDLHIPSLEMLYAAEPPIYPVLSDLATCGATPCP